MLLTVFPIPVPPAEHDLAPLLPLLPEWRREQALRFRHSFGQYACAKTWLLLLDLLARQTRCTLDELRTWPVAYNDYGKPFFPGHPDCCFSISHCRTALAVALDNRPVGVDVEHIRPAEDSLIARTMSSTEQAQIAADPAPERAFTALWTRKEAVLKLRGTGIIDDLHNVLTDTTGIHIDTHAHNTYIYSLAQTISNNSKQL